MYKVCDPVRTIKVTRYAGKLIFVLYVAVICLAGAEILIRALYRTYFYDYNMEMWRYASDLKRPRSNPLQPFEHVPNKAGDYYGVSISTNSLGFWDREYSIEKPAGKTRILILGDSFTLGWGVPVEQTFAERLESMLNESGRSCEVLNMGIGNYNSVMETELFKSKRLDLKPDVVILMYFLNDTEPVPRSRSGPGYTVMKNSYLFSFVFDRFTRIRCRFIKGFDWDTYYRCLYSPDNSVDVERCRGAVLELSGLCRDHGARLIIFNLPELRTLKDYRFGFATDFIRGVAQEAGVPFADLLPALANHEPESLWVSAEDPHANAKANRLIAEEIYDKIIEDGLM